MGTDCSGENQLCGTLLLSNFQLYRHIKVIYLSQRAYTFPVVIVFLTTNHLLAASGVPQPSTRGIRTVSTRGTLEVYETSQYRVEPASLRIGR